MAITKKEQAAIDKRIEDLMRVAALRWTSPVEPDVAISETGLAKGFCYWAKGDWPRVEVGCSSLDYHSRGIDDRTTSHGRIPLYSTRLLALKAMRHEVETLCAEKLMRIDRMIEQEEKDA
jgi:hypothetical protein